MAPRTVKIRHDEEAREHIKTIALINRVQDFALGEDDPRSGRPVEMTRNQLTAALNLIRKRLADLSTVTLSGDPDNPLQIERIERAIIDPKNPDSEGV